MSNAFDPIIQNALLLKLTPISLRELLYMQHLPCDIYGNNDGVIQTLMFQGNPITKDHLKNLIQKGYKNLFVLEEDYVRIIGHHQNNLRNLTRSFSVGDPLEKGTGQLSLLSINMAYLYEHPTNDDLLNSQYQSAKNLAYFLLKNINIHPKLYYEYIKQQHHYVFTQPLLSSLFLLGILKQSMLFNDKEIENLFVTSYFKDIGMSAIPVQKYNQEELSDEDKKLLSAHAKHSVEILSKRLNLPAPYLKIIEHHHLFSMIGDSSMQRHSTNSETLMGIETMLVSITDIIAAMISKRPYREACNLYQSLELVRTFMKDQYPHEFRLVVNYFKQFFKNIKQ